MCNFESLAELYSSNTIDVEKEYINLIINTFNISSNDKILDIGCGSGSIILPLSQTTPFTYGIDLSKNMINIAKKKDVEKKTQWLVGDILKYNFPIEFFNLIISFEAIHLLTDMNLFFKKITPVLKTKGYLCMGFCIYNWETPMYKDIVKILNQNEIYVDNWFFQDSKAFENIILNHYGKTFSPVEEKKVEVKQLWTSSSIARYITSISLFSDCNRDKAEKICYQLNNMILKKYGNVFNDESQYFIRFSQKL